MGEDTSAASREESRRPARRRGIWVRRLVASLLLIALPVWIGGPWVAGKVIQSRIPAWIEGRFDGTGSVERVSVGWNGDLSLMGVRLAMRDGTPLAVVPEVRAHLSPGSLLDGRIALDATVVRPRLTLRRMEGGATNLAAFLGTGPLRGRPAEDSPSSWETRIAIDVQDAVLDFDIGGRRSLVSGIAAAFTRESRDPARASAEVSGPGIHVVYADERLDIDFDPGEVARRFEVADLSGRPVHGSFRFRDGVHGSLEMPDLTIGRFTQREARLDLDVQSSDGTVDVRKAEFRSATAKATASGKFERLDQESGRRGEVAFDLSGERADIVRDLFPSTETRYAGRLGLSGKLAADDGGFTLSGDGTVTDFPAGETVSEPSVRARIDGTLDRGVTRALVRSLSLESGVLSGTAKGDVRDLNGAAELVGGEFDFRYVPDKLEAVLGERLPGRLHGAREQRIAATLSGKVSEIDWRGLLRGTQGDVTLGFDTWTYEGFDALGEVKAAVAGGHVRTRGPVTVNGGQADLDADFDMREAGASPSSRFEVKASGVRLNPGMGSSLGKVNPIFHGVTGPLDGKATAEFQGTWRGPIDGAAARRALEMRGSLRVSALTVEGSALLSMIVQALGGPARLSNAELLADDVRVANGVVSYDALTLRAGEYDLVFAGTIDFDGNVKLSMKTPITSKLISAYAVLEPYTGKQLTVPITGTLSSPRIDWEVAVRDIAGRAIEGAIEQKVKEAAPEGLQDLLSNPPR